MSFDDIPEDLCCELFDRVLQNGLLTPRILALFRATNHPLLLTFIRKWGITDDIPIPDYASPCR